MRITIPQDWNGEDWACVQVDWPDSPQWFGVLAGLISQVNRGWGWQETAGVGNDIPQVMAVAQEILARNWPWRDCNGEIIPPPSGENGSSMAAAGGGLVCFMECDMGCFDISSMLKIENGVLYALDHCCNWVEIGAIAGAGAVTEIDAPGYDEDNPDPEAEWYACGKAYTLGNRAAAVMQKAWDEYVNEPWEFITQMKGEFPDLTLDLYALTKLWGAFNGLQALYLNEAYFINETLTSAIICELAASLDDTPTVSDAEYNAVRPAFNAAISGVYAGGVDGFILATIVKEMYDWVLDAIGKGTIKNLLASGAGDSTAECTCPEITFEVQPPEDLEWFYEFDFTIDEQTFVDPGGTAEYVAGEGWRSEEYAGYDINLQVNGAHKTNTSGSPQTCYVTWVRWVYSCDSWVSGVRVQNVKMDAGTPYQIDFQPVDGSGLTQLWQGYGAFTMPNGTTPSIRMQIIRDEAGPDPSAYHAIVARLQVGGYGTYEPFTEPS
jgi:hypothetical protein